MIPQMAIGKIFPPIKIQYPEVWSPGGNPGFQICVDTVTPEPSVKSPGPVNR